MSEPRLDLLVVTDLHYAPSGVPPATGEVVRHGEWARLLLRKTLLRLRHMGRQPDGMVFLGDLLEKGHGEDAEALLRALAEEAQAADIPVLAVAGNHDPAGDLAERVFQSPTGFREFGGYGFLLFRDPVGVGDVATRRQEDLDLPIHVARKRPDLPLIALQHHPLYPPIDSTYPFLPSNVEEILAGFDQAGVLLSLSGHCHWGTGPVWRGATLHRTTPALCESPFRFDYVRLRGRDVQIESLALRLDVPGLSDIHCHTELAYCASSVRAETNVALSRAMGVEKQALTEHAFHLYLPPEEAWSFRWQTDRDLALQALAGPSRMEEFRALAARVRGEHVRVGLEVDWREGEGWLLRPGDEQGWDLLIGGVHALPGVTRETARKARRTDLERLFLRQVEDLLAKRIHVLTHPYRVFTRWGLEEPTALDDRLIEMLKAAGAAAEINFHDHPTADRFYSKCLARGVPLALGTDAHDLAEVGELYPHVETLRRLGVDPAEEDGRLFRLC